MPLFSYSYANSVSELATPATDWSVVCLRFLLSLTAVILATLIPAVAGNPQEVALLLCGLASLVIVSLPVFMRRDYCIFEPLSFVILVVLMGVSIKLPYIVAVQESNNYVQRVLLLSQDPRILLYGSSVVVWGLLCLVLGYSISKPVVSLDFIFLPRIREYRNDRFFLVVSALVVFSLIMLALFVVSAGVQFASLEDISAKRFADEAGSGQTRIHTLKYLFYRGAAFSKFAFYLSLAWVFTRKSPLISVAGLLLALSFLQTIALFFLLSSRANAALLILDALIIVYFLKRTLKLSDIAITSGLVLLLLLPMLASRDKSNHSLANTIEKSMAGRDLMDISKTCHIINAVPSQMPYRYGETLTGWLVAPIPRAIWPDKPMWAERGPYLMLHVFGDRGGITGIPPGLVAELYWNLGLTGVCLGMFLLGLFTKTLFLCFMDYRDNGTAVLIYTVLATRITMFTLGNDLGTGILKAGLDLVPLVLLILCVGRGNSSSDSAFLNNGGIH